MVFNMFVLELQSYDFVSLLLFMYFCFLCFCLLALKSEDRVGDLYIFLHVDFT